MLDQDGRTPLCTKCSFGAGSHASDCRARFEAIWTKELVEAEVPIRVSQRGNSDKFQQPKGRVEVPPTQFILGVADVLVVQSFPQVQSWSRCSFLTVVDVLAGH